MRKDDYKEAINEIKASTKLKNETISKITNKKSSKKWVYAISTVMIAVVIAISIVIPIRNNNITEQNDPIKVIADNGTLPKIENFDTLKGILKSKQQQSS